MSQGVWIVYGWDMNFYAVTPFADELEARRFSDESGRGLYVKFVADEDGAEFPNITAGAAVGTLGAEEATLFAATCRAYVGGMLAFDFSGGQPVLVEVKGS